MQFRRQRTIRKPAQLSGVGLFSGVDATLRFLPAADDHGIVFQRLDSAGTPRIPAKIENVVPRQRRTAIGSEGVTVEMVEHVMAALAGLQIDNCLIQIDAPEVPGFDGSCLAIVDALWAADFVEQSTLRETLTIRHRVRVPSTGDSEIIACGLTRPALALSYHLDYGPRSPITPQNLTIEISPETFATELAFARTFVLESEIEALRAQGYGLRMTPRDLLVFGNAGVIGNRLKRPDECVRHKILDCLGDFALIGCDLRGYINACRSGHELNRELVRRLQLAHRSIGTALERIAV